MESLLKYWYWLGALSGVTALQARRLLEVFGNPYEIFQLAADDLRRQGFLQPGAVEQMLDAKLRAGIEEKLSSLSERGVRVIPLDGADYPALLKEIEDPPPILYMRGEAPCAGDCRHIAVVGSRRPTAYGLAMAEKLVEGFAAYGFGIVSGLAMGIDAAVHRTALECGAKTYAFLGCGVDKAYPASNWRLMEDIVRQGAVFSEYPPGSTPFQQNFPRRNRLISGMSVCVVVAEAGERSGALITARCAGEQGRDVFAAPGNATSPLSAGANALIKDGAGMAVTADDVIFSLNRFMAETAAPGGARPASKKGAARARKIEALSEGEKSIIQAYSANGPLHADAVASICNISAGEAGSLIIRLEIKGFLNRMADGLHVLAQ